MEPQRQKYGWEFVFFGANMDAIIEAGKLGIAADWTQNYRADCAAWSAMSVVSTAFRKAK